MAALPGRAAAADSPASPPTARAMSAWRSSVAAIDALCSHQTGCAPPLPQKAKPTASTSDAPLVDALLTSSELVEVTWIGPHSGAGGNRDFGCILIPGKT